MQVERHHQSLSLVLNKPVGSVNLNVAQYFRPIILVLENPKDLLGVPNDREPSGGRTLEACRGLEVVGKFCGELAGMSEDVVGLL